MTISRHPARAAVPFGIPAARARLVHPEDDANMIGEKLGTDRAKPLHTFGNRPVYFGHRGAPIPGGV